MRIRTGIFGTLSSVFIALGFSASAGAADYTPDQIEGLCRCIDNLDISRGVPGLSGQIKRILEDPDHPCHERILARLAQKGTLGTAVALNACRPDNNDRFVGYP